MKIGSDKIMHALVGAIVCGLIVLLGVLIGWSVWTCLVCGVFSSIMAGLAKEIYDQAHADIHTPDKWDAAATMLGGISMAAFIALVRYIAFTLCIFLLTCGLASCAKDMRTPQEIKRDQVTAHVVGEVWSFLGIPAPVGEGLTGLALTAIGAFVGHKNGRRKERHVRASHLVPKVLTKNDGG